MKGRRKKAECRIQSNFRSWTSRRGAKPAKAKAIEAKAGLPAGGIRPNLKVPLNAFQLFLGSNGLAVAGGHGANVAPDVSCGVGLGVLAVGCPERFAQEALGHNSRAVNRAYAKRALIKIPSLEDYEQRAATHNYNLSCN